MEALPRLVRGGRHAHLLHLRPGQTLRSSTHWRKFRLVQQCHPPTRSFSILRTSQISFRRSGALPSKLPTHLICRTPAGTFRSLSTKPLPNRGPLARFAYRAFAWTGIFIVFSGSLVLGFFIYDASTYSQEPDATGDIAVSEAALSPRRGGPKNLPIAEVLVDDEDCESMLAQKDKPKLVILGTGWGSVAMLKEMHPGDYHITVVSPDNYFLFTPMLPSATVGTLELRSLVEPIRRIVNRLRGHFLKAEAVEVNFNEKLIEVVQDDADGKKRHFYLPYDKLVIGVGSLYKSAWCQGLGEL